MTPKSRVLPTTTRSILMGKAHQQQRQFRILRDITPAESAEFGDWGDVIGRIIGTGIGIYGQIKGAEAAGKASEAQAEAAVRIAEERAAARAETMRRLAPILGLAVLGGTLVTVILVKKKRKKAAGG